MVDDSLRVEVAYATATEQWVIAIAVPPGTTVAEAIQHSGITGQRPELEKMASVGIYGKVVAPEKMVRDGDRIEIYRPLVADPKQARRRRAASLR